MPDYTITLSDADALALSGIASDIQTWIQEAAIGRAIIAKKDIIPKLVQYCNENNVQLAVGEAAQLQQASDLGLFNSG